MAGYSGTPLAKMLGIHDGSRVTLLAAPAGFAATLAPLPEAARILRGARAGVDVVLYFTRRRAELEAKFDSLKGRIEPDGGLVDTKICAVDAIWSGLRFVYRLADRAALQSRRLHQPGDLQ